MNTPEIRIMYGSRGNISILMLDFERKRDIVEVVRDFLKESGKSNASMLCYIGQGSLANVIVIECDDLRQAVFILQYLETLDRLGSIE